MKYQENRICWELESTGWFPKSWRDTAHWRSMILLTTSSYVLSKSLWLPFQLQSDIDSCGNPMNTPSFSVSQSQWRRYYAEYLNRFRIFCDKMYRLYIFFFFLEPGWFNCMSWDSFTAENWSYFQCGFCCFVLPNCKGDAAILYIYLRAFRKISCVASIHGSEYEVSQKY